MAQIYDGTLKKYNGVDWDSIRPKTLGNNVECTDGKTVEQKFSDLSEKFSDVSEKFLAVDAEITNLKNPENSQNVNAHMNNTTIHVTSGDRTTWNNKLDSSHSNLIANGSTAGHTKVINTLSSSSDTDALSAKQGYELNQKIVNHSANMNLHVTQAEKNNVSNVSSHIDNSIIHVNSSDKNNWNGKLSSSHANLQGTSSQIGHLRLMDSLTSDDHGAALSAYQGKYLHDLLNINSKDFREKGYCKLPNGFILQWGFGTGRIDESGGAYISQTDVTFPISFPTKRLWCVAQPRNYLGTFNSAYSYGGNELTGANIKLTSRTLANVDFSYLAIGY